MFWIFRRARAIEAAVQAIQSLMAPLKIRGPIPTEALHDPYVLGFISIVGIFHAGIATKGNPSEIGEVFLAIHKDIGGTNQPSISEAHIGYATTKNDDYMRGQRNADKIIGLMYDLRVDATDADIADAFLN